MASSPTPPSENTATAVVEQHPFEPFLPEGCRMLMLGSFPPSPRRWSMRFYYPNFTNDMWRIFGHCFFADKAHFVDAEAKTFRLDSIVSFLCEQKIGMYDTAQAVRRLRNTASDKDLQVVRPTDLAALLRRVPQCTAIVVTGQKACDVLRQQLGVERQPAVGTCVEFAFDSRTMHLWRMPSSSRAYPMRLEDKAKRYAHLFESEGLLTQPYREGA